MATVLVRFERNGGSRYGPGRLDRLQNKWPLRWGLDWEGPPLAVAGIAPLAGCVDRHLDCTTV